MKRNIIYGCLLFILSINMIQAQEKGSKEERIQALKVAFISEELDLTSEQSQKFWPLYNEFQTKLNKVRKNRMKRLDVDNLSEAELELLLEKHLKAEEEKVVLSRTYIQQFKKVISIRQVVKLTQSEYRFRRELLRRAKERRESESKK